MALISVLWGIALLSIVAVSFLSAGGVSYRLAHNAVEIARTDAVAEAAVNRAVLALLDPQLDRRWRTDGVARAFDFDGASSRISIQDELGRIDLNHADASLLIGLFKSAGLDAQSAGKLVDKILDWRDANPAKRLNGAKEQDYRMSSHGYRPRNGAFQSVHELKLVMDMTPDLFKRVEPALTVYSDVRSSIPGWHRRRPCWRFRRWIRPRPLRSSRPARNRPPGLRLARRCPHSGRGEPSRSTSSSNDAVAC